MNNELIERIGNMLSSMASTKETLIGLLGEEGKQGYELAVNLLQDCKAALAQQQEAESIEHDTYNAVEQELATIQSTVSSFETPAKAVAALIDWHVQVALDPKVNGQQEAEPVAWLCKSKDGQVDAATTTHQKDTYARVGREILPLYLCPPKPAAQPQAPEEDAR